MCVCVYVWGGGGVTGSVNKVYERCARVGQ